MGHNNDLQWYGSIKNNVSHTVQCSFKRRIGITNVIVYADDIMVMMADDDINKKKLK